MHTTRWAPIVMGIFFTTGTIFAADATKKLDAVVQNIFDRSAGRKQVHVQRARAPKSVAKTLPVVSASHSIRNNIAQESVWARNNCRENLLGLLLGVVPVVEEEAEAIDAITRPAHLPYLLIPE